LGNEIVGEKGKEEGIKGCRNRIIHSPHVGEDKWLCLVSARMHSSVPKRIWKRRVFCSVRAFDWVLYICRNQGPAIWG